MSRPPSAPSAKPSASTCGPPASVAREEADDDADDPDQHASSTSGNGCHGAFGRSATRRRARGAAAAAGPAARCVFGRRRRLPLLCRLTCAERSPVPPRILGEVPRNDPTDTGGLFIGRRPGTGPVHYRGTPERGGAGRRRADGVLAALLLVAETLLCLSVWGPQPLAWLWIGSQADYRAGLEHARDRRRLRRHPRLAVRHARAGVAAGPRLAARCAAPRATTSATGALARIFGATAVIALVAFGFWFLLHPGPRALARAAADAAAVRLLPAVRRALAGRGLARAAARGATRSAARHPAQQPPLDLSGAAWHGPPHPEIDQRRDVRAAPGGQRLPGRDAAARGDRRVARRRPGAGDRSATARASCCARRCAPSRRRRGRDRLARLGPAARSWCARRARRRSRSLEDLSGHARPPSLVPARRPDRRGRRPTVARRGDALADPRRGAGGVPARRRGRRSSTTRA